MLGSPIYTYSWCHTDNNFILNVTNKIPVSIFQYLTRIGDKHDFKVYIDVNSAIEDLKQACILYGRRKV